ncbi:hypothetical protein [[Acidovorax] ebreus]|jgi:hypothetical protein|uniref:hypothetical protein n=1 Tax=Diaphorobacter sp. LI3 TaxID=2952886 RepID=UPI00204A82CA|nr:hypothetical protein MRB47_11210 [Diaphorobacter sp. LI3]
MLTTITQFRQKIREINQRYSQPHIEMSTGVRISLIALRIYLLFLVGLMIYKFVTLLN